MRKLVLMAALAAISLASAQEGTFLVGGNVGFSTVKEEAGGIETKSDRFEFSPRLGCQLAENWTVGIAGSIGSSSSHSPTSETDSDMLKAGPFIRYARAIGESGLFAMYGDLDLGYQSKETTAGPGTHSKSNGFYGQFTPALFINFKNGFGLNFSVGGLEYGYLKDKDGTSEISSFDLNLGKTFSIGVSKNFSL